MSNKNNNGSRGTKSSRKTSRTNKTKRLRLKVGEPWKERLRVRTEHHSSVLKNRIGALLGVTFILLLVALTAYAMGTNNNQILADVMTTDKVGLAGVGVWATGRAALKVLSGWKDHN